MKTHVRRFFICITIVVSLSCSEPNKPAKTVSTTVSGHVLDIERELVQENVKVILSQMVFGGSGWSGYGYSGENKIDSTYTDFEGYYTFNFEYDLDPQYKYTLSFEDTNSSEGPFADFPENYEIKPGENTILDIDYWHASYLKLNLEVRNNDTERLGIANDVASNRYYHFRAGQVQSRDIDTTIYLVTKPNSDIFLTFYYSTGYSNAEAHKRFEYLTTTLQDTTEFTYQVDCYSF